MPLSNHTFCWNGIISSDPAKTLAFFPEVLGWSVQEIEMDGDPVKMLTNAQTPVAHVRSPQSGEPNWWNNYLRVEDVDATTAAVKEHGGTVVVPPTDIPPGRFSTVATPSGARLSLFHEAQEDQDKPSTTGFIHWVDLHSKDLDRDLAFIHEALGLSTKEFPMPDGVYHVINPDGKTRGGAMKAKDPRTPSMWTAWIAVDDVDQTLERVTRHGGTVLAPAWDAETVGRMAIAADPVGVAFGVITPPAQGG